MVPNAAVVMSELGDPKLVWFRTLKNSDRNCKAIPSRAGILKRLLIPSVLSHQFVA